LNKCPRTEGEPPVFFAVFSGFLDGAGTNILLERTMKRSFTFVRCLTAVLALVVVPATAHEPGAHVHGLARLQVGIDGKTLTLNLESPLDNLLGFEHIPRTDKDKTIVRNMAERLKQAASLFAPTRVAQCVPVSVKLESPILEPPKGADGGGHADLDAEFVFRCERPDALRDLEVRLFDYFANLRQLDVQVAGPRGQAATRLSPNQRRIAW
jgi:hypothetical protein